MGVDTLSIAQDLRAAHLTAPQAEAIASAIGRALVDNAASKSDLDGLEQRFSAKLENVEQRFSTKLAVVEQRFSARLDEIDQRFSARLDEIDQRFSAKLDHLDQRFSAKFETLEHGLNAKIEAFRSSMLIWFIGTQVAIGALIVALVKL